MPKPSDQSVGERMALHTLYRHGSKAGIPPRMPNPNPLPRGRVKGWTTAAARRNADFLMSIREQDLHGDAVALTLTTKEVPPPEEWAALRQAWIKRQRRKGLIRLHWVTEWTAAARPHTHAYAEYDDHQAVRPLQDWLELTQHLGTMLKGQRQTRVYDATGWNRYTAKHAARGVRHYQRSQDNVPQGWETSTGRLWGYWGEWPRDEGVKIETTHEAFYAYRRMVRSWRVSQARHAGQGKSITRAREMLKCTDPTLSRLRGISEWIGFEESMQLLKLAASNHPFPVAQHRQAQHVHSSPTDLKRSQCG